ncbi:MAG: hypothetical protein ACLTWR_07580 [Agathobaculum desmolans]
MASNPLTGGFTMEIFAENPESNLLLLYLIPFYAASRVFFYRADFAENAVAVPCLSFPSLQARRYHYYRMLV